MSRSSLESLTPEQRAWLVEDERRWQRADRIAEQHPGTDVDRI
jgi:Spy/CpxP family protein refolding chaperone